MHALVEGRSAHGVVGSIFFDTERVVMDESRDILVIYRLNSAQFRATIFLSSKS